MKRLILTLIVLGTLSGCSNKSPGDNYSQIVAKVNGDEITVSQVNAELQRIQKPVSNPEVASKKILENLIDRQLLVQEAIKLNLDHSPEVVQLVDATRAQIYAQAYLSRKLSTIMPAKQEDVRDFMIGHPEVFRHRKVLATTDIIFNNDPSKIDYDKLQAIVGNLAELKSLLVSNQIQFDTLEEQIPSESMPKQALSMIEKIKVGDLLFMRDDNKIVVRSVNSIVDAQLEEKQSVEVATRIVNERKRQEYINGELSRLKRLARIDFSESLLKAESLGQVDARPVKTGLDSKTDGLKGL